MKKDKKGNRKYFKKKVNLSNRKKRILDSSNFYADNRLKWKAKSKYFHKEDAKYLSFIIPKKSNILDIVGLVGFVLDNVDFTDEQQLTADMNIDGVINILDIVQLVNFIL